MLFHRSGFVFLTMYTVKRFTQSSLPAGQRLFHDTNPKKILSHFEILKSVFQRLHIEIDFASG